MGYRSPSREVIPVPRAEVNRSRSRAKKEPEETPQLVREPSFTLPFDEEEERVPQFRPRRGRSPVVAPIPEETPQLPELLRKRLEARREAEAQGQGGYMQTELGRTFQRFRANLHAKQAMQKRAASAVPLRRESFGEIMDAIERSAMRPSSPGNRRKITIGTFDKRQRVGPA